MKVIKSTKERRGSVLRQTPSQAHMKLHRGESYNSLPPSNPAPYSNSKSNVPVPLSPPVPTTGAEYFTSSEHQFPGHRSRTYTVIDRVDSTDAAVPSSFELQRRRSLIRPSDPLARSVRRCSIVVLCHVTQITTQMWLTQVIKHSIEYRYHMRKWNSPSHQHHLVRFRLKNIHTTEMKVSSHPSITRDHVRQVMCLIFLLFLTSWVYLTRRVYLTTRRSTSHLLWKSISMTISMTTDWSHQYIVQDLDKPVIFVVFSPPFPVRR